MKYLILLFLLFSQISFAQVYGTNPIDVNVISTVAASKIFYGASVSGLTVAATATDIFSISGSASKTIKIRKVEISATQTTLGQANIFLIKRSSADSNNSTTSLTAVPFDSGSAAATAAVVSRTANPSSLGAAVGTIKSSRILVPTLVGSTDRLIYDFTGDASESIVLRGTAETLNINLNATTILGNNFNISIEWTEE